MKIARGFAGCVVALCSMAGVARAEIVVGEWTSSGETGTCGGGYSELINGTLSAHAPFGDGEVIAQTDTNCTTARATEDDSKYESCPGATRHRCIIARPE